jgi:transposase
VFQTHDHLSVMGGVTPTGRIYVLVRQESLNGLHTIEFLKHLIRHIGPRLLVIWDGSPIHRRVAVNEFLASADGRGVRVERLPPYAPDLNPVEAAWQHLKHVELRNLPCLDLEELHLELHLAIGVGNTLRGYHSFSEPGTRLPYVGCNEVVLVRQATLVFATIGLTTWLCDQ